MKLLVLSFCCLVYSMMMLSCVLVLVIAEMMRFEFLTWEEQERSWKVTSDIHISMMLKQNKTRFMY